MEPESDPWAFLRGDTKLDAESPNAAGGDASETDAASQTESLDDEIGPTVDEAPALDIPEKAGEASAKKKEKSLLGEFVGVVVGGLVGLSIAYYGLNWWGGERANFLNVYLPGIPHTYQHRPDWMPDWMPGADRPDAPADPQPGL
jgi:hypothetical protein